MFNMISYVIILQFYLFLFTKSRLRYINDTQKLPRKRVFLTKKVEGKERSRFTDTIMTLL